MSSTPVHLKWALASAVYLGLSVICALIERIPPVFQMVGHAWSFVWILGPPILLVHGRGYVWPYIAATVFLVGAAALSAATWRKHPGWAAIAALSAGTIWVSGGWLVYVPYW